MLADYEVQNGVSLEVTCIASSSPTGDEPVKTNAVSLTLLAVLQLNKLLFHSHVVSTFDAPAAE